MRVRALLLSDTHLGFDLPTQPRIRRRRRGPDFLANYRRALAPAMAGAIDLVVHCGDVFHRSRVPHTLVYQAFEPLRRVAEAGIPVFVVPGNHERSRIPCARFAAHPGIHVFDQPRTVRVDCGGRRVEVAGFPYEPGAVRARFPSLVETTGLTASRSDIALLCVHHCFEGATVGPADYTFRDAADVIRGRDVPTGIAAVLTGHVHRHQVLTSDLSGRALAAPVIYPGSTERTAFTEMGESKGYVLLDLEADGRPGGRLVRWTFVRLPARPMIARELRAEGLGPGQLESVLRSEVDAAPGDAVLRIRLHGPIRESARPVLTARRLRALTPAEMNLELVLADEPRNGRARRARRVRRARRRAESQQAVLDL